MIGLRHQRHLGDGIFSLEEELDDYRTAQLAAAEYRAEGWLCRVEPVELASGVGFYRVWVGPERKVRVRTLAGEEVFRTEGTTISVGRKKRARVRAVA